VGTSATPSAALATAGRQPQPRPALARTLRLSRARQPQRSEGWRASAAGG